MTLQSLVGGVWEVGVRGGIPMSHGVDKRDGPLAGRGWAAGRAKGEEPIVSFFLLLLR